MKKRLICLILLFPLLFVGQVGAVQVQEQAKELVVDGDEATFDTEQQTVEFAGNVVVEYDQLHIVGDLFYYQQADGQMKVTGHVQFEMQGIKGRAQSIQLDQTEQLLTISGDVEMTRDGQLIRGNTVTYNLETGVLRVEKAHLKMNHLGG